jgi:hypothetical protein
LFALLLLLDDRRGSRRQVIAGRLLSESRGSTQRQQYTDVSDSFQTHLDTSNYSRSAALVLLLTMVVVPENLKE